MIISLLMLFVMVLSVSATFAAEDSAVDAIAADNEITDDVVASEAIDDSDAVSEPPVKAAPVVTNDTFHNYFDSYGNLNSTEDELVFSGDFSDIDVSAITIAGNKPVKFTGTNGATFKNVQFQIMQSGVTISGFNIVTDENNVHSRLIWIISPDEISDIVLSDNNIQFIAPSEGDAYAIFAGAEESMGSSIISGFKIINNNITFVGSNETKKNNVIRVNGNTFDEYYMYEPSENIEVNGNTFDIQMPSIPIDFDFNPDTYEYKETPMSEGIVFYYCDEVKFIDNTVNIRYNKVGGAYGTINVVSVYSDVMVSYMEGPSKKITIKGNEIIGVGHYLIYGIKVSADQFEISDNKITASSEEYYANGINVEGPSSNGLVKNNTISLQAPCSKSTAVYGIYTWQTNGAIDDVEYLNNNIDVEGYLGCAMEINQPNGAISNNILIAKGNFTYGIAASIRKAGQSCEIKNNTINCLGNNVGFGSGDPILKTASAGISTLGTAVIKENNISSTALGIVCVDEGDVELDKNTIDVTVNVDNWDNYGIKINGVDGALLTDNIVLFHGKTDGSKFTNGLYIFDTVAIVSNNDFNLIIPAGDISYDPVTYEETASYTEGIVIDYVDNLIFEKNNVTLVYGDVVGYYDTIRVVDVTNSNNVVINKNNIKAFGNNYIYGLKLTGNNFKVSENAMRVESYYYTNGINIEGPASGIIDNNTIVAVSPGTSYPIYTGMTSGDLNVNITNNRIGGKAYYVVGVELAANKTLIDGNEIIVVGNHTIGIGVKVDELIANNNKILSEASNIGNQYIWDSMGTDTTGINVLTGDFVISNNNIETTGDYAAILGDNSGNVTNNHLLSSVGAGNDALIGLGNVNATGNPATENARLKVIIVAKDLTKVYGSDDKYSVTVLDENGKAVANKTIYFVFGDGSVVKEVTDADGVASVDINFVKGDYFVTARFEGDLEYGSKSISNNIVVNAKPTAITAPNKSVLLTAVKKGATYKVTLKDNSGNVLADKKVTINGKEFTTDKNGVVNYKLSASKAGSQKLTIKFDGDDKYAASTATATIKFTKEATKLTAAKKVYKVKAKAKRYTVTLKDSKNKPIKKVRVTVKIGKVTYKAFTNAKGVAAFNLKLAKVGNFKAAVKFAGDKYYNKAGKTVVISVIK